MAEKQITLSEKVYRCLATEGHYGAVETLHDALPGPQQGRMTEFELDQRDFALAVGLAYGIARGEDPYESDESVSARAGVAALEAFSRWGTFTVTYDQDRAVRPYADANHEAVAA